MGRPKLLNLTKRREFKLSAEHDAEFKRRGGLKWLRCVLDKTSFEVEFPSLGKAMAESAAREKATEMVKSVQITRTRPSGPNSVWQLGRDNSPAMSNGA